MFIDTHMHIDYDFGINPDEYISNANNNNVKLLISSFCEKDDLDLATEFVDKYDCLYACIGFHPEVFNKIVDNDFLVLEDMLKNNKKFVGVGEIGLDYNWDKNHKDKQKYIFEKQLEIAERLNLPVVIHSRESIGDTYEILKNHNNRGVIHCFSGSIEMAKKFIALGYVLGIGGVVTFKNSNLPEVVREIPLSSIVLETDSPYLSPNRGETNQSSNIPIIASKIAEIKGLSIEEVMNTTTASAIQIFDL